MTSFEKWKYRHYFTLLSEDDEEESHEKNIKVRCKLCLSGSKTLSTSKSSTSNLKKHIQKKHGAVKIKSILDVEGGNPKQPRVDECIRSAIAVNVTQSLAKYVIKDILPLSVIESPNFIAMIRELCPNQISLPCKKTVSKYIDTKFVDDKKKLLEVLKDVEFVCTTADIWTANNKSFFGMTCHWICPKSLIRKKYAISCSRFYGSHTYYAIAEKISDVHTEFDITFKVTGTVTDNASNFVKAFRVFDLPLYDIDKVAEEIGDSCEFVQIEDILENGSVSNIFLPHHVRCAAHTLNLVSTDMDKYISRNMIINYKTALAKSCALWNKSSRSTTAAEIIEKEIKLKLIVPTETRWNSLFKAIKRIIEIDQNILNNICIKLKITPFENEEITILKRYCDVAQPLAEALDILQGEDHCYYGSLLPVLYTLKRKLANVKNVDMLENLPEAVIKSIDDRFSKIFNEKSARLAAVSHPFFKNLFVEDFAEKISLRNLLLEEMKLRHKNVTVISLDTNDNTTTFFDFGNQSIIDDKEIELNNFFNCCKKIEELPAYPTIKSIFLKYNTTLPSSAPVERLFSMGGNILTPKRNRLSDERFEKLIILKYNTA